MPIYIFYIYTYVPYVRDLSSTAQTAYTIYLRVLYYVLGFFPQSSEKIVLFTFTRRKITRNNILPRSITVLRIIPFQTDLRNNVITRTDNVVTII
jgi:hypothetical protein